MSYISHTIHEKHRRIGDRHRYTYDIVNRYTGHIIPILQAASVYLSPTAQEKYRLNPEYQSQVDGGHIHDNHPSI